MQKKLFTAILTVLIATTFGTAGTVTADTSKVTKWVFSTNVVPGAFNYRYQAEHLANLIAERTDGLVQLQITTELMKANETLYGIRDGRVPIGFVIHPYFSADVPLLNISSLPWLLGWDESEAVYEWPYILDNYMAGVFEKIYAEKFNSVLLATGCWVANYPLTAKPIKTMDDWKGLKIRAHGVEGAEALQALGSSTVTMTIGEARDAVSRGMVDGLVTDLSVFHAIGLYEVCKYTNYWPMAGLASWSIVANKKAFDALPADLQRKVKSAFKYFQDLNNYKGIVYDDRGSKHLLKKEGQIFIRPTDEEIAKGYEAIKKAGIWERFVEKNEKMGFPGAEVLQEVQRLLEEFRTKYGRRY